MKRVLRHLRRLHADQRGQATLEWVMLLVAVGIPSVLVFRYLLYALAACYQMVTFLETLPFP